MLCRYARELSKYTADSSRQRSYPSDYLNYFYNWTLVISYINVKLISTGQTSLIDTLSLPLSLSLSLTRRNGLRKLRQERISQQSGAKSQKCQSSSVSSNDFLQL